MSPNSGNANNVFNVNSGGNVNNNNANNTNGVRPALRALYNTRIYRFNYLYLCVYKEHN